MTGQASSIAVGPRMPGSAVRTASMAVLAVAVSLSLVPFRAVANSIETLERWQVSGLLFALCLSCLLAVLFCVRSNGALNGEIARREALEEQASTLARHDPLTGLPNQDVLVEHLGVARKHAKAIGKAVAVLLVDLDRFKPVNDVHGHGAGDLVLTAIAERLQRLADTTRGTMIARLRGDEFAVVVEYDRGTDKPVRIARQIVALASQAIDIGMSCVSVGASVGIAACNGTNGAANELLRQADVAMCQAKRNGRATFHAFDHRLDADLRLRSELEAELRHAIPSGEVVPFYQPIMSVPGREVVGFESLARWIHPTRGLLLPECFISIAENAGLIDELTFALLRRACVDARDWPAHVSLSINISPLQLTNDKLPGLLLQIIADGGFAPGRLIVEITESGLVADLEAARRIISALKTAGVKIALDDFGTGYSSLSHLHDLQFDSVKIDRSFIKRMGESRDEELVKAIIGMGHIMGMGVTAEGVETEGSLSALAGFRCNHVQGFLFGRPASAEDSLKLFAAASKRRKFLQLVA